MNIILTNLNASLRGLVRDRLTAFLMLSGMTLGLASFIIIYQVVINELSFDRFHTKSDRIHRVISDIRFGNSIINSPTTMPPLARAIADEMSGIEMTTRVLEMRNLIGYNKTYFNDQKILAADSNFLQVFDFNLISGNRNDVMNDPGTMLISQSTSAKFFGKEDPVGKELEMIWEGNGRFFKVSGVFEDCPENSSINFDYLIPMASFPDIHNGNWGQLSVNTFVVLQEGTLKSVADSAFPQLVRKYVSTVIVDFDAFLNGGNKFDLSLQPFTKVHLHSDYEADYTANSSMKVIYIMATIAFLIIVIFTLNYISLYNIWQFRGGKKTILMRLLGSSNFQITVNHILLSVIICIMALAVAIFLVMLVTPYFENRFGNLEIKVAEDGYHMLIIFLFTLLTGILSGFLPAMKIYLNRRYNLSAPVAFVAVNKTGMRAFVTFQNVLSICLVITAIVIFKQTSLLTNKNPGYDKNNLVVINNIQSIKDKIELFKETLASNPDIREITVSGYVPSRELGRFCSLHFQDDEDSYSFTLSGFSSDDNFLATYGINMAEGKFIDTLSGIRNPCVLNRTAIDQFKIKNPIGKVVNWCGVDYTITGIIPDFNYESFRLGVRPLIITPLIRRYYNDLFITVRCNTENLPRTMANISNSWEKVAGNIPFDYKFLDESLASLYEQEKTFSTLTVIFGLLAILIACLGIFGLSSFTAVQRTKEIGIRKVNGARVAEVMAMLNKDFIIWIAIAFIIACPVAWYAMHKWLENFAYKTELSWWIFAAAGVVALTVALVTVSWQSWRAARRNPVEALRYE